jgi:hypothetical protein
MRVHAGRHVGSNRDELVYHALRHLMTDCHYWAVQGATEKEARRRQR